MTRNLDGRRLLVTGGAGGIGLATTRRLLADGATVAVLDRNALDHRTFGERPPFSAECDVAAPDSVAAAVSDLASRLGGIDGVVTCAGVTHGSTVEETSPAAWQRMIDVNLTGTFLCVQQALPYLLENPASALVTIGSVGALVAAGRSAAYDATKGGVLALTRSIAVEYADRGLRANCVCPGLVATDLAANSAADTAGLRPDLRPTVAGRVRPPAARAADPAEIAAVIAFALSADASFVTGACLPADGGYTAV
ncbi:SDR family NAD(P)-dependent oxidoreductase [Amycolatopsis solani]|uniref:SDR family NAD(P)-dependent oxidoreductase n=1 Tax=Amycolatopsis solani TaxID=3028615 RepID=UPI0025B19B8B|nr:SDR family oxidoreductase [Amycolatopsis sp. MEP2-6]